MYVIKFTVMDKQKNLEQTGTFNARAKGVCAPLFDNNEFFDARDLVQVKYEAIRAIEKEQRGFSQVSREFGLSRPTLYEVKKQFEQDGLAGLLPHKRGPKKPHKLNGEILKYAQDWRRQNPERTDYKSLAERIEREFSVRINPRTLQRALINKAKKGLHKKSTDLPTTARPQQAGKESI